jgi:hypothetical protein
MNTRSWIIFLSSRDHVVRDHSARPRLASARLLGIGGFVDGRSDGTPQIYQSSRLPLALFLVIGRIMRTTLGLALIAGALVMAPHAAADGLALSIELPQALHVGDHRALVLTLDLPSDAAPPLLVTPRGEGEALEIVRGRLLRADARDPQASPLVFDLPIVAQKPGTAVVRVRAAGYRCREGACQELAVEAVKTVLVLPR